MTLNSTSGFRITQLNDYTRTLRFAMLALLSFLLPACAPNYSDPESVALDYIDAVYAGSTDSFKKMVEEKDYYKTQDYQLFVDKKSSGRYQTKLRRDGIASVEVTSKSIGASYATVNVKVMFKDKTQKSLRIKLHNAHERWFVDPMTWRSW